MNRTYAPLHVHSHYSLLDGLPSPQRIVQRAEEIGAPAIALTDHGSIFGIVAFAKAARKAGIKSIPGIELYVCLDDPSIKTVANNKRFHLTVLARNEAGLSALMKLVSETNRPDYFYRKPRINLAGLAEFTAGGNLICLSGCLAGRLSSGLFVDLDEACRISTTTEDPRRVRRLLRDDWKDRAAEIVEQHQRVFGRENFWIELQNEGMAVQQVVVDCLRDLARGMNLRSVATLDAHYACKGDAEDQRLLLYSQMHTTAEAQERLKMRGGDTMAFFHLDTFHIYDLDEMKAQYTDAEIEATLEIADMIRSPEIGRKPCLPKFSNETTERAGCTSDEYLARLCREGAADKLAHLSPKQKKVYWARIERELRVIAEAKLADYFLIVWDACNYVDSRNGPRGKGRGSGAGSLVNYVLGITDVDPIEYGLLFERFYNASRNIPPHFNAGARDFMSWYGENFENLHECDPSAARHTLGRRAKRLKRMSNCSLIRQEAKWIDEHNPRMWCYLSDQLPKDGPLQKHPNPHNSHLAYALGLADELDAQRPVETVEGHVSLPDIDVDIGVVFRGEVIEYLKRRWGEDHVAQMITFGRLQGKAALKEVFRAQPDTARHLMRVKAVKEGKDPNDVAEHPFDVCNDITRHIPDEAMIVDDLRQMREETGDDGYGILRWAVEHVVQVGRAYEWYKPLFDQAMRIEGTKKSQSRHAGGIVIADAPIADLVPLAYDAKTKARVCGLEMGDAETMGAVKFDFLGVTVLDKLWFAERLVNGNGQGPTLDQAHVAHVDGGE